MATSGWPQSAQISLLVNRAGVGAALAVRGKCAKPSAGMPSGGRSPGTAAMTMTEDAKIEKYTAGSPAVHT